MPKKSMVITVCEQCKARFPAKPSKLKEGNSRFCSITCYRLHRKIHGFPKHKPRDLIACFWKRVDKNGGDDACWLWQGSLHRQGYGRLGIKGKMYLSHRLAYIYTYGPIPDAKEVCHQCDNPPCCNPRHFFLGTHLENMQDCAMKKRLHTPHGEQVPNAKLTEGHIRTIRTQHAAGISMYRLAKQHGVSDKLISNIVKGRAWAHVS